MHILVVEDERALCETIVRSLRRLAYSVDFCHDGNKAIELLGVERYDLALLDLNLPGADGMTVRYVLQNMNVADMATTLSSVTTMDWRPYTVTSLSSSLSPTNLSKPASPLP